MRPGARAFIRPGGAVSGLVSGGCLEKDLAERAHGLSAAAPARLVTYDLRDDAEIDFGLGIGCKGKLTLLIEQIDPSDRENACERLDMLWSSAEPRGAACALVLDGDAAGARLFYVEDGGVPSGPAGIVDLQLAAALRRACQEAIGAGRSRLVSVGAGAQRAFVEYLPRRPTLAIFGAGADAIPVVQRAKALGWRVTLWDQRESAIAQDGFAACDERHVVEVARMAAAAAALRAAAVLVMTHNYRADLEVLRGVASVGAPYVGLLGPRERARELRAALAQAGVQLGPIFSPAGLDLGAETPEAIALAIIAEIHAVLCGRTGGSLRHRGGPIHERTD